MAQLATVVTPPLWPATSVLIFAALCCSFLLAKNAVSARSALPLCLPMASAFRSLVVRVGQLYFIFVSGISDSVKLWRDSADDLCNLFIGQRGSIIRQLVGHGLYRRDGLLRRGSAGRRTRRNTSLRSVCFRKLSFRTGW